MSELRVVWPAPRRAELEEFTRPEPGDREVLVRTDRTLVSQGTERGWLSGKYDFPFPGMDWPFYPGYASVGRVEAVGSAVRTRRVGDRVFTTNGGYGCHATCLAVAEDDLFLVPEDADPRKILFFVVADVALAAVRRARVELGESGVVVGLGLIGQLAVQAACANGAVPVIGVDPDPGRRALALRSGAHSVFSSEDRDGVGAALAETGGADFAIELVGGRDDALQLAMDTVRVFGRVIGASRTPRLASLELNDALLLKSASLTQLHITARPREESRPGLWSIRDSWRAFLRLLAAGRLDPLVLPSVDVTATELPRVYVELLEGLPPHVATTVSWGEAPTPAGTGGAGGATAGVDDYAR